MTGPEQENTQQPAEEIIGFHFGPKGPATEPEAAQPVQEEKPVGEDN